MKHQILRSKIRTGDPVDIRSLEVECVRGTLPQEQMASIRAAKQRLPSLRWLMVSRDRDAQSSVSL